MMWQTVNKLRATIMAASGGKWMLLSDLDVEDGHLMQFVSNTCGLFRLINVSVSGPADRPTVRVVYGSTVIDHVIRHFSGTVSDCVANLATTVTELQRTYEAPLSVTGQIPAEVSALCQALRQYLFSE